MHEEFKPERRHADTDCNKSTRAILHDSPGQAPSLIGPAKLIEMLGEAKQARTVAILPVFYRNPFAIDSRVDAFLIAEDIRRDIVHELVDETYKFSVTFTHFYRKI